MTESKPKKKKKLKLKRLIIFLLTVTIITYTIYHVATFRIKNIYVSGNIINSDYKIIELAKIDNYPLSVLNPWIIIENRIKKEDTIKSVDVSKNIFGVVTINVVEYTAYFTDMKSVTTLEDGKTTTKNGIDAPLLVSDLSGDLYKKLVSSFKLIKKDIILKISEIEYKPSALDNERFLFLMADGNYCYITLNKMGNINFYNKIVTQLAGKKGIINLDSYRETDAGITIDILNN